MTLVTSFHNSGLGTDTHQAVRGTFHNPALTLILHITKSWRELRQKKTELLSQGITPILLAVLLKEDSKCKQHADVLKTLQIK